MRLVTTSDILADTFGDLEAVRILASNGFDAIDWSFFNMERQPAWQGNDWREHAMEIRRTAEDCGIGFGQSHAPFPTSTGEEEKDKAILAVILQSMEAASILGCHSIIIHPRQHLVYAKNKKQLFQENVAFYTSLIPYCEQFGIHVCVENMWQYDHKRHIIVDSVCAQPEEFCAMIDAIHSPWITACLDIGHAALVGVDPADAIRALGHDRLQALHVHDVDYLHDCHTLPFNRDLDWDAITAALAEIHYEGDFTFEADAFLKQFPPELRRDASVLMERTGRYLVARASR